MGQVGRGDKMGGKSSRNKGHSFERDCAIKLRKNFPKARRQLEYHLDDCKGVDITNTGRFKFQCKKTKRYVSINTILEIEHDKTFGDIPVLIAAGDFQPAMVVMGFDDFLEMLDVFEKRR